MLDLTELAERDPTKDIESHYRRRFTARYHHNPVLTEGDQGVFEWLNREFGSTKAMAIIDTYLKSQDKFLCDKGHAPKFIKTNINALITKSEVKSAPRKTNKLTPQFKIFCDRCGAEFVWSGVLPDQDRFCDTCKKPTW